MTRTFYTWPHTARKIVEESLREFVGDGEGEDYEVLTTFINEVQAEALHDAAAALDAMQTPDGGLPDSIRRDPALWLCDHADRLGEEYL